MNTPLSPLDLEDNIFQALKAWHDPDSKTSPLAHLRLYQQVRLEEGNNNPRQITNEILHKSLEILENNHPVEALLLHRRFLDGQTMAVVANQINLSTAQTYRKQKEAIQKLALLVQSEEVQARAAYQARLEKRLNLPPEVQLFGVESPLKTLQAVLASPEPAWLVSIEGLGGLGKTALAAALLRRPELTGKFSQVGWVSAKQQEFLPGVGLTESATPVLTTEALVDTLLEQFDKTVPLSLSPREKQSLLTERLKQKPHLIVIDNLETVVDYQTLLPLLRTLANPSKFLLTSRHSLQSQPDLFCLSLAELNQAQTIDLIRYEANTRGLSMLINAPDSDLATIYQIVGGNPLALKLVIGQIAVLPLSEVLKNLQQAQGKTIDELYTYIYWQAWQMLSPAGRQALLVMPLVQDGSLAQWQVLSRLAPDELLPAIQQLAALSLVQVSGNLEDRRYTIHRLTETFLLNEAIKWQSSA